MLKYMVGGAVRDRLMGLKPKDVDFVVVGSTPADMLAAGFKQVGADFPVFLSPDGTEYALARTERKTGRGYMAFETNHSPDVTLEQDLERRDLTINAMAVDINQPEHWMPASLVDPFNGRKDLEDKVLRHVSPAFADDPVRVLRLARFHARYGADWTVAPETLDFCRQMVQNGELAYLTRERVLKEMEKALGEQAPHLFFDTLRDCGALDVVFPELSGVNPDLVRWAMLNYKSTSGRFNYAKLSTLLPHPDNFEKRLNVSLHFRSFAKLFRNAASVQNSHPVDRLYDMDVFRQKGLWDELLKDAKDANFNLSFLEEAYNAVKHVCFETLPEGVKDGLEGKAIGRAILEQRRFAYESSQRKK